MEQHSTLKKDEQLKKELDAIDGRIEELEGTIELGKMLTELHEDERFKKVILEAYLEKEAERVFGMLTTPSHFKRDQMENLMDMLTSIRNFKKFFATILVNADMAPMQIEDEKQHRLQVTEDFANGVYDSEFEDTGSEE